MSCTTNAPYVNVNNSAFYILSVKFKPTWYNSQSYRSVSIRRPMLGIRTCTPPPASVWMSNLPLLPCIALLQSTWCLVDGRETSQGLNQFELVCESGILLVAVWVDVSDTVIWTKVVKSYALCEGYDPYICLEDSKHIYIYLDDNKHNVHTHFGGKKSTCNLAPS